MESKKAVLGVMRAVPALLLGRTVDMALDMGVAGEPALRA